MRGYETGIYIFTNIHNYIILFSERIVVENMLVAAKGSIEKAKRRIDNFYKYRGFAPELIQNREKLLSDPDDLWSA